MSLKIFIPNDYFYLKENCDIYGEIRINENNAISYYIIAKTKYQSNDIETDTARNQLRHLGHIVNAKDLQKQDVAICFAYDMDTKNIYLHKLSIKPGNSRCVSVFLYDRERMLDMQVNKEDIEIIAEDDELGMLYKLLHVYQQQRQLHVHKQITTIDRIAHLCALPFELMTRLFILIMQWKPMKSVLSHTVLYKHYAEWQLFMNSGQRNVNIVLDRILGICLMLLLLLCIPHPDEYLMKTSKFVIQQLHLLLNSLRGNPVGLKLNVQLNNFFLDCFLYHVALWEQSLRLLEPFLRQLFMPIACIGCLGVSFHLALLADIISIIALHARCFYIYAAILYKVEIKTIRVLWKVMLGKRFNVLKNRVESHNYMNRQLYLATIFFTSLIFLFPTILVYYCVFTTLRLCIVCVNILIETTRRCILEFPIGVLWKWLKKSFYEMHSIQLQRIIHMPTPLLQKDSLEMSVFKINVLTSSLAAVLSCESGVLKELKANEIKPKDNIFCRLLNGTF